MRTVPRFLEDIYIDVCIFISLFICAVKIIIPYHLCVSLKSHHIEGIISSWSNSRTQQISSGYIKDARCTNMAKLGSRAKPAVKSSSLPCFFFPPAGWLLQLGAQKIVFSSSMKSALLLYMSSVFFCSL